MGNSEYDSDEQERHDDDGELETITCNFYLFGDEDSTDDDDDDEPIPKRRKKDVDEPYDGVNKAVCTKAGVGTITRAGVVIKKVCYYTPFITDLHTFKGGKEI